MSKSTGNPNGRPIKYTAKVIADWAKKLDEYTDSTDIPQIAEFCYTRNIRKQRIYEFIEQSERFSDSYKKLYEKGEFQLVKMGLLNLTNSTMTIFCLKQKPYMYTDRQEVTHNQDERLEAIQRRQEEILQGSE